MCVLRVLLRPEALALIDKKLSASAVLTSVARGALARAYALTPLYQLTLDIYAGVL